MSKTFTYWKKLSFFFFSILACCKFLSVIGITLNIETKFRNYFRSNYFVGVCVSLSLIKNLI